MKLFILAFLTLLCYKPIIAQPLKSSDYQHLLQAPQYFQCDTITMVLKVSLWYNMMPMADNDKLYMSVSTETPYGVRVQCPELEFHRLYYFFGKRVYKDRKFNEQDTNTAPDAIVAEYKNTRTGEVAYLLAKGPFGIGEVP